MQEYTFNDLLTIKETCAVLGIHRDTLRSYTTKGMITAYKHANGAVRYSPDEITRFLNNHKLLKRDDKSQNN